MPYKGYVNVSTSMKKEDAERLQIILKRYGYYSLHQFLKSILKDDLNSQSTDLEAFTSKNNIPNRANPLSHGLVAKNGSRHQPPKLGIVGSSPTGPAYIWVQRLISS